MKDDIGKIRLRRIETDTLRVLQELTKARTSSPMTAQGIRDVASQFDAITSHLWIVAAEMEPDGPYGTDKDGVRLCCDSCSGVFCPKCG